MKTSNGKACDATPCSLRMSRKSEFTATISKPGYEPIEVSVGNELLTPGAVAFAGNIFIGGIFGMFVDYETGAALDLTPDRQTVALKKIRQPLVEVALSAETLATLPPQQVYEQAPNAPTRAFYQDGPPGRVMTMTVHTDGSVTELRDRGW